MKSNDKMDWIKDNVSELCKIIRKDAISLVDAFNYSDYMINSPLGRYDGNVYQNYFDTVRRAHRAGRIPSYFESEVLKGYSCIDLSNVTS
jgi:acyl-CoA oxidase